MDAEKLDKAILGLENCIAGECYLAWSDACPYSQECERDCGPNNVMADALELLHEVRRMLNDQH